MSARLRPRLSRTLARGRWREYRRLLEGALAHGYRIVPLERWVREGGHGELTLVMRHDVDQHPGSALEMAAIERDLGVESTWYLRWRTADQRVVADLRASGATVGLHYETLSRLALRRGVADAERIDALVGEARAVLRDEVAAFARIHGPIASICPHGDSRIPVAQNRRLLQGEDPAWYGIEFDANEAMRGRGLAHWLTDRSSAEGGWVDGARPEELFAARTSPMLCVVHPNNWVSGPGLWLDRLMAAALPAGGATKPSGPLHTGTDAPPL